jgi:methylthioribose-1-phosphate isomerase
MDTNFRVIEWHGDGVTLLDQRRLPIDETYQRFTGWDEVAVAITEMVVRGAPAIGITAAYGVVLGARQLANASSIPDQTNMANIFKGLAATRPTAVNLFWALDRMQRCLLRSSGSPSEIIAGLEAEAILIHNEDRQMCAAMGRHGAALLPDDARVLTHCNTGALATGGAGTALAVIRYAHQIGRLKHVLADETRPFLQGARLTAWELHRDGVPVSVITDNMAADFMRREAIDAVLVGTDRVTANGDVANKIGTYGLAVLCKAHDIPFYVVGPTSTIDLDTATGDEIEIERRPDREVTHVGVTQIVPSGVAVENPAFDVTPAALVSAIITEHGVVRAPYEDGLIRHVKMSRDVLSD